MIILAFDLSSTNIGWLVGTDESQILHHGTASLRGKLVLDRLEDASDRIQSLIYNIKPDLVTYESQAGQRGKKSFMNAIISHSYVIAYLLLHSMNKGIVPVAVAPREAKKALTGKGNATKEMMIEAAKPFFDDRPYTEHEADALGVFHAFLSKGTAPKKKPRKRIAKVVT